MASTTYRRDKLRRLAEKGRLMMVQSYSYDDMHGSDRQTQELPVRIMESGQDFQEGWCNLRRSEFDGKSGRAYEQGNGTILLIVHSNSNMTFRVLPEGETAQPLPPLPAPEPAPPLPPPPPTRIAVPFIAVVGMRLRASFAKLNKRGTLAEYREECRLPSDYREELCEVEAVRTLSAADYDHFAEHLMDNVDWLGTGRGGAGSDADLPDGWQWETGTKDERAAFVAQAYTLVTVIVAPGRETFVVNAEEYSYARYVGLDPAPVGPAAPAPETPDPAPHPQTAGAVIPFPGGRSAAQTTMQTREAFTAALGRFLEAAQRKVDERFAGYSTQAGKLSTEEGPKYIRVVVASGMRDTPPDKWASKSAYCFIDKESGHVWKPAGYKGPERKNPRSCIYDADRGASGVTGYGTAYLR